MKNNVLIIISLTFFALNGQELKLGLPVGHTAGVNKAFFSPDDKYVLTIALDKNAKVWDSETGKYLFSLKENNNYRDAIYSPNGNKIATLSGYTLPKPRRYTTKIWDAKTGKLICNLEANYEFSMPYTQQGYISNPFNPDGTRIVSFIKNDSIIKILDTSTGEMIHRLVGHKNSIKSAFYNTDGSKIITTTELMAKIWDANSGKLLHDLMGHTESINSALFSLDGKKIITTSKKSMKIWNAETGELIKSISMNYDIPGYPLFSPEEELLITISDNDVKLKTRFINLKTGEYKPDFKRCTKSLNFSPNGKKIIATYRNKDVAHIIDAKSGKLLDSLKINKRYFYYDYAEFSPNGKKIVTVSAQTAKIWNAESGKLICNLENHARFISDIALSPNEKYVAVAQGSSSIRILDFQSGKLIHTLENQHYVRSIKFNNDNNKLLSVSNKIVKIWNVKTGQLSKTLNEPDFRFKCASFSPDGNKIVTGSYHKSVKIWDTNSGDLLKSTPRLPDTSLDEMQETEIIAASFNPEGNKVITTSRKATTIRDAKTMALLDSLYMPNSWIQDIKFIPNGEEIGILIGKYVKIWNPKTNEVSQIFKEDTTNIGSSSFSTGGKKIVSWFREGTIQIWNAETGKLLFNKNGHSDMVRAVSLGTNDTKLISGSRNGSLIFWDIRSGNQLIKSYFFGNNKWVHIHPTGLFDASPEAMELMYWTKGLEVIEFSQLKNKYYTPGLWKKVMNDEYLGNADIKKDGVELYPEVVVGEIENNMLPIYLTKREGGYGDVNIYLNGKEIIQDARPKNFDETLNKQTIYFDITNYENQTINGENTYEVKVKNKKGDVTSRGAKAKAIRTKKTKTPSFHALLIGVSDYVGDDIDLKYPVIDIDAMENALQLTTKNLFKETHIIKLATNIDQRPRKEIIKEAVEKIAKKSKAEDVFMVYMSGHGINWSDNNNISDFYFLTEDARFTNKEAYNDEALRKSTTISTNEWVELIKKIPANKIVMVIDACGSGQAVENLVTKRDIDSDQIKAIDRMKDRTGMFVISGSAANQVSYEASKYGQGLLTYTLLKGMSGVALKENSKVDVSTLFNYAKDEVPRLAEDIGGIQEPLVLFPKSGSFDIGILNSDDQGKIVINEPKQVYVRSNLLNTYELEDNLELSVLLDKELNSLSTKDYEVIWVDANKYSNGCKITGTYKQEETQITLSYKTKCKGKELRYKVSAKTREELIKKIMRNL
ncbi:WD40 domain-containing protein [Flavivirga rizhaonensis]|uniref:Uncharacterized protein n=1 Tax=Flavivirga rizhaonensis TaxID=2559571 RepID=A0A4S1E2I0_9FLAO|nr:caspase family protein [Flavivirga rizhaonensis]TGV04837.1 hypothetical protein EM932_01575 [Flavivirga rizhaonensis]